MTATKKFWLGVAVVVWLLAFTFGAPWAVKFLVWYGDFVSYF